MNKIQELIQQKLALEIANKAIQIAGLEAELEQARETIANLESQLETAADLKGGDVYVADLQLVLVGKFLRPLGYAAHFVVVRTAVHPQIE